MKTILIPQAFVTVRNICKEPEQEHLMLVVYPNQGIKVNFIQCDEIPGKHRDSFLVDLEYTEGLTDETSTLKAVGPFTKIDTPKPKDVEQKKPEIETLLKS